MSGIGGINIPSSTVVAIGGGFVCLAFFIITGLFLLRATKMAAEGRRRRAAGENITFREIWRRDGGMLGFVTGLGADSALVGAGGRRDLSSSRAREEIRMWAYWKNQGELMKRLPKLWEIGVEESGSMVGQDELSIKDCQPLGVIPSQPPDDLDDECADYSRLDPTLSLSVLIILPAQQETHRKPSDEWLDLPEMMIGTTRLVPYVVAGQATESNQPPGMMESSLKEEKEALEDYAVPELSDHAAGGGSSSEHRAGWRKKGKRWAIEGINDVSITSDE
ncbi:hypothetical protein BD324DRAFT_681634 [Kockovaella imperatae]|uniref:Uncharacterized protein n=1 Tax=Kockovaella imperatae TaxID=4999 RepID=A0A1Y1UFQ3_9TREE|nr:hypothetical protein BD324DRAFT_681634 [Kockovaella imperatae]ORX36883.1 hypothetical protein BD324DRAFT_681634 [Kockovaella imperatae]